jgi:uroporphyrinogen decarboxylase
MSSPSPRDRVNQALAHQAPDRTPVDFLASPQIWDRLLDHFGVSAVEDTPTDLLDPRWEMLLRRLQVDCRVLSYDQFFQPPDSFIQAGCQPDWFRSLGRSTPSRMWRQYGHDGLNFDIWGRGFVRKENPTGAYEQNAVFPLESAQSAADISTHLWPQPDWWDFSAAHEAIRFINNDTQHHIRYRIGSVFEVAWQMRGMEKFLMELTIDPDVPMRIMATLTDIYLAVTERFLKEAGDAVDMVYFYDDIATQNNLMISRNMLKKYIFPHHARLIDLAKKFGKQVMYHSDGAIASVIPDLIDMGIDVLNPIQKDAKGMAPDFLKETFGDNLSFHGGIDIIRTLPLGTPEDVRAEVSGCVRTLGDNGGYILASSHHIQPNTPLENVLEMYDLKNREV